MIGVEEKWNNDEGECCYIEEHCEEHQTCIDNNHTDKSQQPVMHVIVKNTDHQSQSRIYIYHHHHHHLIYMSVYTRHTIKKCKELQQHEANARHWAHTAEAKISYHEN